MEPDAADQEYPSLDSVPSDNSLQGNITFSPRSSEPPSLTESMQLMDEILSDKTMDRIERIDKLEAILSAATLLPNDPVHQSKHDYNYNLLSVNYGNQLLTNSKFQVIATTSSFASSDTLTNSSNSYDSFQVCREKEIKRYLYIIQAYLQAWEEKRQRKKLSRKTAHTASSSYLCSFGEKLPPPFFLSTFFFAVSHQAFICRNKN